jgi:shikimate kinase
MVISVCVITWWVWRSIFMEGRAVAPGAGTILNALANTKGAAFAIDVETTAEVTLNSSGNITGEINDFPNEDTALIERCLELVIEKYGDGEGGHVRTTSEIPLASGLKSSSAAANAAVLAALDALGLGINEESSGVSRVDAARIGVSAARDVGVTVTGAFDDASASMLGGITITNNDTDELLSHEPVDWDILVWTPPTRAYSADAAISRCHQIEPLADFILETALEGNYPMAMTLNGLAFSAALGFSPEPLIEALPSATGVSLSGTGPSVTAIGTEDALSNVTDAWSQREGKIWWTTTQNDGARTI